MDKETFIHVGTIWRGEKNSDGQRPLIAEYFFRDIQINPEIPPEQFQKKALTP